ncbi:MAG: type II toxin-antitoxin system MqsA family antitoxin [Betaproteobacteria bacterium]|nr:type II toxin-antitoxin system MqsA family antitoxin [Betaproteobacteria bacterium]
MKTEKELLERDAKRDIGAELLEAARQMKAGKGRVTYPSVVAARTASELSQAQFAALMGVSVRTLQEWEQGRRKPSGAAQTLLAVATRHPEVLRELAP